MAVVTSCGHGVTPLATTPWSPAKTATTDLVGVRRRAATMDSRQDHRDLLEYAQRAGGLGEGRLAGPGRVHRRGVERPDRVDGGRQQVRGGRHEVIVSKAAASPLPRLVGDHVAD